MESAIGLEDPGVSSPASIARDGGVSGIDDTERSSLSCCIAATNCIVETIARRVGLEASPGVLLEASSGGAGAASIRRGAAGPIFVPAGMEGDEASFERIWA